VGDGEEREKPLTPILIDTDLCQEMVELFKKKRAESDANSVKDPYAREETKDTQAQGIQTIPIHSNQRVTTSGGVAKRKRSKNKGRLDYRELARFSFLAKHDINRYAGSLKEPDGKYPFDM
jgi:hypothetical protein